MCNFKIGQKVKCIKSFPYFGIDTETIYTISKIICCPHCNKTGLLVNEINYVSRANTKLCYNCGQYGVEGGYRSYFFRPVEYQSATSEILEKFKLTEEKADVKIIEKENV